MEKMIKLLGFAFISGLGIVLALFFYEASPFSLFDTVVTAVLGALVWVLSVYTVMYAEGGVEITKEAEKTSVSENNFPLGETIPAIKCANCGEWIRFELVTSGQPLYYRYVPCRNCHPKETK